ncbi:MAG: hypothetical protein GXO36_07270 [Chloroflexi bacterium]|nr:hypothetical protein [Chloroflexota bacterium]
MPRRTQPHPFEEYCFAHFARAIQSWDPRAGIYAIGLEIQNVEDDLRRPMVRLLRNTWAHARLHAPGDADVDLPAACLRLAHVGSCFQQNKASSEMEALWCRAFWDFTTYATVGCEYPSFKGDYIDPIGLALRDAWVRSLGLHERAESEADHPDATLEDDLELIVKFNKLCLRVARRLQPVIRAHFKRPIPIIFFNREGCDDETVALTWFANEKASIEGYLAFICQISGRERCDDFKPATFWYIFLADDDD